MDGPPETKNPPPVAADEGSRSSTFGKRLNRYGNAKSHTIRVMDTLGSERAEMLGLSEKRIRECGNWLLFRDYHEGPVKLLRSNFCHKHLVCALCAIRRSSKHMAAYLQKYEFIRAECTGVEAYLATLTVRNSHDLDYALNHLLRCLRLLHRRRNNPRQPSIMDWVVGGVYAVEITHNPETGWHPHVHAIWLSQQPEMADQAATFWLRREWEQITGDSFMCDIRPIVADLSLPDDINPQAKGFAEVFKYAMKPSELGPDLLCRALPWLLRKRLVGSFGWLRGVPEPDDLGDSLDGFEHLAYEDFLVTYAGGRYERDANVCGLAA